MHNFEIKISKNFLERGSGGGKVSSTKVSAINSRFYQIQQTMVKTTKSFSTNYGRLRRNAQNEITYSRVGGLYT